MSVSKFASSFGTLATLAAFASQVQAHGFVTGIEAGGTSYTGYLVNQYPYQNPAPDSVGWAETATDLGFVDQYNSDDVICHKTATNAKLSATVAAGSDINLKWGTDLWPASHHGPVQDYLAKCDGDCATVDKKTLKFVKIDGAGLIDDTTVPGTWASDQLIANNNTWTTTIPSNIAAGNYVLRHEIIALHSAGSANGAQVYPQCFNLKITGGGDAAPAGTLGTELYTAADPGIQVNIYEKLTYDLPGPDVPTEFGGKGSGGAGVPSSSAPPASSPASTSAATSVVPTSTISAISSVTSKANAITSAAPAPTQAPSAVVSAISSLTAALPSSVLTSIAPTITATPANGQPISTAGLTVSELLDLLQQILTQLFTSPKTAPKTRRHARDIVA